MEVIRLDLAANPVGPLACLHLAAAQGAAPETPTLADDIAGVTDITFISAEGVAPGGAQRERVLSAARSDIAKLTRIQKLIA